MKRNEFELIGRLNYVEVKTSSNGNRYARILLSKKGKGQDETGKDVYHTYPIVFFGDVVENIEKNFSKGLYVHVVGYLMPNVYNGREEMRLNGQEISAVAYNESIRDYEVVSTSVNNGSSAPSKSDNLVEFGEMEAPESLIDEEEIPF